MSYMLHTCFALGVHGAMGPGLKTLGQNIRSLHYVY